MAIKCQKVLAIKVLAIKSLSKPKVVGNHWMPKMIGFQNQKHLIIVFGFRMPSSSTFNKRWLAFTNKRLLAFSWDVFWMKIVGIDLQTKRLLSLQITLYLVLISWVDLSNTCWLFQHLGLYFRWRPSDVCFCLSLTYPRARRARRANIFRH